MLNIIKRLFFAAPTVKKEKNQDQTPAGKKPLDKISLRGTLMFLFFFTINYTL